MAQDQRAEPAPSLRQKVQVWIYRRSPVSPEEWEVLLLLLRPERGGFWQPVTGSVDPGEDLEAAALREATEETGLRFLGRPKPLHYSFQFKGWGNHLFEEHAFALEAETGLVVRTDPHEHVDSRWVSASQVAQEKLRHSSNVEGLQRLLRFLGL